METEDNEAAVSVSQDAGLIDKLFVYGIFLNEANRNAYKLSNPRYDTVPGYITIGDIIVQAVKVDCAEQVALTGLTVDFDKDFLHNIDTLETGYDRAIIKTNHGHSAFMYVSKQNEIENFNKKNY